MNATDRMDFPVAQNDDNNDEAIVSAKVYSAPALEKGLDILEVLSNSEVALTQKELSVLLGRSVNEFYRMLTCLVRREYVSSYQDKFSVTTKMFRLSQIHPPMRRLLTEAMPMMQDLARQVNFSCDLRVYNQGSQTVIASVEAPSGIGFAVRVGSEISVGPTASGRVLIGFQAPEVMELRIRESLANSSAAEMKAFRRDVHEAAVKGFASIDSHQYAGVHAVSFPVLDNNRHAIAAVTVPMLPRVDGQPQLSQREVEQIMRQCVSRLSERVG
ncbi:IclR family transcriptional regulator [Rhizobium wenxiniae]|uniref:DNA-binding IclR family transcriptional regulator n=1 Tax=Rhizobium wenxiniae TaxID=1737357 RepID=A0A7W9YB25_9HYPH|nr:IclR family transcriptional regulator [Rhizobium wenxiniae]MBB6165314.1 DNA-binding IclR family transcriptional regulator [Rhizobium wenxiniae]GGG14441.1 IclR family transcriptional regulator [Rhizobium wenxiniae]